MRGSFGGGRRTMCGSLLRATPDGAPTRGGAWTDQGAAEPAGFSFGTQEYSSDSGATWTASYSDYTAGETGSDSGDGANAGQFRQRSPHQRQRTWVCLGVESVFTDVGESYLAADIARIQPCLGPHVGRTFTSNVDDGIEPPGDWCVVGASAIICRGEGYTYREARRELRF